MIGDDLTYLAKQLQATAKDPEAQLLEALTAAAEHLDVVHHLSHTLHPTPEYHAGFHQAMNLTGHILAASDSISRPVLAAALSDLAAALDEMGQMRADVDPGAPELEAVAAKLARGHASMDAAHRTGADIRRVTLDRQGPTWALEVRLGGHGSASPILATVHVCADSEGACVNLIDEYWFGSRVTELEVHLETVVATFYGFEEPATQLRLKVERRFDGTTYIDQCTLTGEAVAICEDPAHDLEARSAENHA